MRWLGGLDHPDHAFQDTLIVALGIAAVVAGATALAISLLLAARIAASIRRLASAAQRVAGGERGVRVSLSGADELRQLSASFNTMTETLERAETQRRAFIADVTHELRTPIATIDGYLEGLTDGLVPPDQDTWQLLRDQASRMRRLVDDLATLTRAEDGRLDLHSTRVPVSGLLESAGRAAATAYERKGVDLSVSAPTIWVDLDPDRIGEVLANLLANALRHTPPAGHVTLTATRDTTRVQITVTDTGEGIPTDELDRVFERFHRQDPSRSRQTGGSGLGLAISRALIEAHHGTIHAHSDGPGSGTRITIDLPTTP
jgi:two-component system sensor histidine kinase BaeS